MNKRILAILLIGIAIVGTIYFSNMNREIKEDIGKVNEDVKKDEKLLDEEDFSLEIGEEAPDFTLENLNGEKVSLRDLRGKNVMINFWATWCPYCVKEMPDLNKLYVENRDKDFVVLAIDVAEPKEDIQKYLKDKSYEFPVLMDQDGSTAIKYMVRGIPTTYMIDKEGKIRAIKISMMTYPEMNQMLRNNIQ